MIRIIQYSIYLETANTAKRRAPCANGHAFFRNRNTRGAEGRASWAPVVRPSHVIEQRMRSGGRGGRPQGGSMRRSDAGRGGGRGARAGGRRGASRAKRSRLVFKTHASDGKPDGAPARPVKDPAPGSPVGMGSSCPAHEHEETSEGFRRFDVQQWLRNREQRLQHGAEEQRRSSTPPPSGRKSAPSKAAGYRRGRVCESTVRRV
jgi:hypothetical protein